MTFCKSAPLSKVSTPLKMSLIGQWCFVICKGAPLKMSFTGQLKNHLVDWIVHDFINEVLHSNLRRCALKVAKLQHVTLITLHTWLIPMQNSECGTNQSYAVFEQFSTNHIHLYLTVDCWLLTVDCWLLTTVNCWLLTLDCWLLLTVDCWLVLSVDHWLLLNVDYWLLTFDCSLLTTVNCWLLSVNNC